MDTGQIETRHLEDEMKRTRARIDGKLDELNNAFTARIRTVRRRGPLAIAAILGISMAAVIWMRRHRRQGLPRYSGIPRVTRLDEAYSR
jgi:hypothetical protein